MQRSYCTAWRIRTNGLALKNGFFSITRSNPRLPLWATSLCLVREREDRINYMLSSFNLKLKENEAPTQEGQTPMEEAENPGDETSISRGAPA